ncbi:putative POM121-like protein 1 isoform X2 [Oryctolagus cuniculus]|uniref:putative POM121-like protein 1 isoform X2 n=1 Tax=Oryctolagus cuniculus TaxID=9986 RepID=UPI0022300429|nr:nuclear envelope pore membrane protein POM 121 isoform X2 [Oryctolagus cuniculus]
MKPAQPQSGPAGACPMVLLKVASANGHVALRVALQQALLCVWVSLAGPLSRPHGGRSLSRPREVGTRVKSRGGSDPRGLEGRGRGAVKPEGGRVVPSGQDAPDSGSQARESAPSAFRRLQVGGVAACFMPRPGPLKRDSCPKSQKGNPQALCRLPGSERPRGKDGPALAAVQAPHAKTPEEGPQASAPASCRETQQEKAAGPLSGQRENPWPCSPLRDPARPLQRKTPLLLPCRRQEPLVLPLPPDPGYRVTAKDLDLEKCAALLWINKVLRDDGAKSQSSKMT